jgi:hypothetical protein
MRRANFMTGWMATAVLWAATVVVSLSPCLAQPGNYRPVQAHQSAPSQSHPNQNPSQNHPSPSPSQNHPNANQNHPNQNHQPPPQAGPGHAGYWLRHYKNVPPGEQERALQGDPAFRHLSREQQQMLRQRLQHFSGLPPQQQQRVLNRMETWEHLTPEQKEQARQVHGQLQQLPPERQAMVKTAVHHLSAMPPEQREQIINSERFKSMFSSQEREIMRGASRLPLAPPENGKPGETPAPEQ